MPSKQDLNDMDRDVNNIMHNVMKNDDRTIFKMMYVLMCYMVDFDIVNLYNELYNKRKYRIINLLCLIGVICISYALIKKPKRRR